MGFLICWRGKGIDVNDKTSSQSKSGLSNRLSPKPHPRVQELTSSQSRTQRQAPASTHRLNTDFILTVSGGMKNLTTWFSTHSSKSRALFSHQRTQLSWTLEVPTYFWVYKTATSTSASKLQIANVSDFTMKAASTSTAQPLLRPKPVWAISFKVRLCKIHVDRECLSHKCVCIIFKVRGLILPQKKKPR